RLGPRFQFIHLENWPGFKAGALNEATRRLPKDVELIGVVDSDYVVRPDWLRAVVGHFADPKVAFVQTPKNYRDWTDDQYLRGVFYSYEYFFEVSMPARAHRNAIICAGTMGVIRRSALEEIGGWNTEVVTEDAEASLRMLANGAIGVYEPRPFGRGLMPLSFEGLKQQRFRWALGGMQILRLHWRRLLLPAHGGKLTFGQRFHTAFLRTPKSKEGDASVVKALRSAQVETLLAVSGVGAAVAMLVRVPSVATFALALLLLFQAAVYANAPWAGAAAEGVHLTPLRRAYKSSAQSTGARPLVGSSTFAMSVAAGLVIVVVLFLVSLVTPPPPPEPPTPELVAPATKQPSPSPPPSASPSPSGSPSAKPSPSSSPSPSPSQ